MSSHGSAASPGRPFGAADEPNGSHHSWGTRLRRIRQKSKPRLKNSGNAQLWYGHGIGFAKVSAALRHKHVLCVHLADQGGDDADKHASVERLHHSQMAKIDRESKLKRADGQPMVLVSLAAVRDRLQQTLQCFRLVKRWIEVGPGNVAVIIGRSPAEMECVIGCWLAATGEASSSADALRMVRTAQTNRFMSLFSRKTFEPEALSFVTQFGLAVAGEVHDTMPTMRLKSIVIEHLPTIEGKSCRLTLLVSQDNRFLYSTFQNPCLSDCVQGELIELPIGCDLTGSATLKAYHLPETVSSSKPRVLLFQLQLHSYPAKAQSQNRLIFPRDHVRLSGSHSFHKDFIVIAQFGELDSNERPSKPESQTPESSGDHVNVGEVTLSLQGDSGLVMNNGSEAVQAPTDGVADNEAASTLATDDQDVQDLALAIELQAQYDLENRLISEQRRRSRPRHASSHLLPNEDGSLPFIAYHQIQRHDAFDTRTDSIGEEETLSSPLVVGVDRDELLARELQREYDAEQHAVSPSRILYRRRPSSSQPSRSNSLSMNSASPREVALESIMEMDISSHRFRRVGASAWQMSLLPSFKCEKGSQFEKEDCIICRQSFQHGQTLRTLPCFHAYHRNCVDTWLIRRATCPICQTPL